MAPPLFIDTHLWNEKILSQVGRALASNELIIAPTETSYMVSGNALEELVIRKVLQFKKRPIDFGLTVVVRNLEAALEMVEFNNYALQLAEAFWPGPLTLILPCKSPIPPNLTGQRPTLGIRVSNHPIVQALCHAVPYPLIATSANRSCCREPYDVETLSTQHGENLKQISIILNGGKLPQRPPSTLVEMTPDGIHILRKGEITQDRIYARCGN